jgi:CBS domain-containing protein
MRVHELMNPDVEACRPDDDLSTAAMIMWRRDCGIVPVVEPSSQRVVGVITDRDICMATATRHVPPETVPVRDVMAKDVCVAEADQNVEGALGAMRSRQVHRLPVVDRAGQLRGVLSIADVARVTPNEAVANRDLLDTGREIHRPRAGIGFGARGEEETRDARGRDRDDTREAREARDLGTVTREEARARR